MLKRGKSTLVGLIVSLAMVIGGVIATGEPESFWNLPSLFIIMGGTLGAVIIAFPPKRLKTFGPVMKKAFVKEKLDLKQDIMTLVRLAEISRREGLLVLEDVVDQYVDDEFLRKGILHIIDGADEEHLRYLLEGTTHFMKQRHQKGVAMLDKIASTAPALGLLGTYVGLIPMLNNLDDPTKLGPMMALELVSSFYGAFIAYVIFAPLAKRLKFMSKEEETRRELLIEGLVSILQGKNPKMIKEELAAFANLDMNTIQEKDLSDTFKAREMISSYEGQK